MNVANIRRFWWHCSYRMENTLTSQCLSVVGENHERPHVSFVRRACSMCAVYIFVMFETLISIYHVSWASAFECKSMSKYAPAALIRRLFSPTWAASAWKVQAEKRDDNESVVACCIIICARARSLLAESWLCVTVASIFHRDGISSHRIFDRASIAIDRVEYFRSFIGWVY